MDSSRSLRADVSLNVGVGYRFVAVLIDSLVLGLITGLLSPFIGVNNIYLLTSTGEIIGVLYYLIFEATLGATPGKLACGLRVVKDDGSSIGWSTSMVRNLLRIIDGLPICYLVGAIIIWSTPQKKRLGDIVAHTVVRRKADVPPRH